MAEIPSTLGSRAIPQPVASVPRYDATIAARGYGNAAAIVTQAGQQLAGDLDRTAGNLKATADQIDETNYQAAKAEFLTKKIEADTAFDDDPDYATAPQRYRETVGKLASESAAGISNPALKQRFMAETGYYAAQGVAGLAKAGHAKSVAARVDWLNETLTTNKQAALATKDPATRAGLQQSTMAMIDAQVRDGIVSPGDAARLKRTWATDFAKQSVGLLPADEQLAMLLPKPPGAKPGAIQQAPLLPPDVAGAIDRAAPNQTDADILKQFAAIESAGNPGAVNKKSGATGLFQFTPGTAAQYGLQDAKNPEQSTRAAAALLDDNRKTLRGILGREPTVSELYLAHQQGATGAAALLANPDQPAVSVLTAVYGDPAKAQAAITQNGGSPDMTAGQFATLWTARFNGQNGATVADAMTGPPAGGWDFSQKTGTAVDFIPAADRAKMIDDAQTAIKGEQVAARQKIQAGVEVSFNDQKQNAFLTGEADTTFKAQIMAAYPDERGVAKVHEIDRMAEMGQVNKQFKVLGAADSKAYIADLAEQASQPGPGSAEAAQRLVDAQTLYDAKQTALSKDPGLWVQQNSPVVSDALEQWQSAQPGEEALAFNIFAATSIAEQQRQGVADPKILPDDVATKLGESVNPKPGQSSADSVAAIRQMEQQFGGYAPQVFGQIGGKMSDAALTVAIMSPSQDLAAARLVEANTNKEAIEKATGGTVGTSIKEAIAKEFADFSATFLHDSGGFAEAAKYQNQAELLARLYTTNGMTPEAAAERARKEIIDPIYDTSTGVRVPVRFDAQAIERGAGTLVSIDKLKQANLDPVINDMGVPEIGSSASTQNAESDVQAAVSKFPALAKIAGNVVVENAQNPGDGRYLESFPPWESENPHPGKFTSQIFDQSAKGDVRTNRVAGDMLHYLGAVDPATNKPVDPQYRAMKEAFLQSMTPQQTAKSQLDYERAKANGWNGTFDQFMDSSRGDTMIMNYVLPKGTYEGPEKVDYTPAQIKILDQMKSYLSKESPPSASGMAALNLSPQEQNLYQHHLDNLANGKAVKNADGTVSTIYSDTYKAPDGKFYVIPTVWDGKILPQKEAVKRAEPLSQWPSYDTAAEADSRYGAMHDLMDADTNDELVNAKTPLDKALAPVPSDPKKLAGYFGGASDADLATIAAAGDIQPEIKRAVIAEQARRGIVSPAQYQYLRSIEANHTWVNSADGQGLVMLDQLNRPVLKDGKPYQVSFDQLQQIGQQVPKMPPGAAPPIVPTGSDPASQQQQKALEGLMSAPASTPTGKGRSRRQSARTAAPAQPETGQGEIDSTQARAAQIAAKPVNERTQEEQDFLNNVRQTLGYDPARKTSTKGGDAAYPPNHRLMNP